jgi:anti-sigma regulatory factor (Ser/Thr protein kinase)
MNLGPGGAGDAVPAGMPSAVPGGTVSGITGTADLCHAALFYGGRDDYLPATVGLLRGALDRDEPVFVAVPGRRVSMLRKELGADAGRVAFGDMAQIGRNPARIIPAVRAFIDGHPGERISYLNEPAWPTRTDRELREAARHEALVNLAFAGTAATIMCPYDLTGLPAEALADAERTHPILIQHGVSLPSAAYLGAHVLPARCDQPLAPPPAGTSAGQYRADLHSVRDLVTECAARAGLELDRMLDLVLAASEVAANTLRHTTANGTVRVWQTDAEILCQIEDSGWITDPLAGRVRPPVEEPGGQGLWLVNQVCDLVEIRSSEIGTTVRMHMSLPR